MHFNMPRFDQGAVIRTALFILILVPFTFGSCRNKGTVKDEGTAVAKAPDSSSLLSLDKMIRENPKSPELFARRAEYYSNNKNYPQALSDITIALRLDSTKPGYFIDQAQYYLFNGEPNSSKKVLNVCLKKFPDNTDAMIKMAEIHLYLKEYGQAKLMLQQVMRIDDDIAQIYFVQGLIALETRDTTGAIKNFEMTIEKEPDYYAAYVQAGKIYSMQNNPLAMQYLKSATDLQPKMYEAHYLLAMYYQEHGLLDDAFGEYDYISTKIDSTLPDPYYNRGYIDMVYKAEYDSAAYWFSKAIHWNPKYADAWYNRGFSHELAGKLNEAKSDYQKAMEIEPNFPLAIKGLNRIEDGKPIKRK
jgi:Tfp pilus assembly protein PilF